MHLAHTSAAMASHVVAFVGVPAHAPCLSRPQPRRHVLRAAPPPRWVRSRDAGARRVCATPEAQNAGPVDDSLEAKIDALSTSINDATNGVSIYLLGMMGSGKSTVGRLLSKALGYYFFDTDELIEKLAGKSVSQIFAEVGEQEFRDMETEVLKELAPYKRCIVSTGGGVPVRRENWGHMNHGITVWLHGDVSLLARRVARDGAEKRPLVGSAEGEGQDEVERVREKLAGILEQRKDVYKLADLEVRLEGEDGEEMGAPTAMVAWRVLASLDKRIRKDAAERERRREFQIVDESSVPNMRVVDQWPTDSKQP